MKKTALHDIHEELNAKMIDFAGYMMPVQYEGVNVEHITVKKNVGVFDVSHMGEFYIHGDEAEIFLQSVLSNDISVLKKGQAQYNCIPNEKGGIVDDLILYKFEDNRFMLVVNASNIKKNVDWLNDNNSYDCKIENKSNDFSLLALQGPESLNLLQKLTKVNLSDLEYYTFTHGEVSEINDVIISRTGYTGELGFELYVKNKYVLKLWQDLFLNDKNLKPIGLAARNTLRLEKGFCLYGNDINDSTSPLEAGLGWITNLSKNFINSDYFVKQKNNGLKRKLVGFEIIGKGIARQHYKVFNNDNIEIGKVTSGSMSPSLNKAIGLAYINIDESNIANNVLIQVRNKFLDARIVKFPFL